MGSPPPMALASLVFRLVFRKRQNRVFGILQTPSNNSKTVRKLLTAPSINGGHAGTNGLVLRYRPSPLGRLMADDDKHPPHNVVPLGRDLPYAVARDLREMYAALVDEK